MSSKQQTGTLEVTEEEKQSEVEQPTEATGPAVEPEAAEPEAAEPDAAEPEAAEPEAAEPEAAEPEAAEPEAAEPEAAEAAEAPDEEEAESVSVIEPEPAPGAQAAAWAKLEAAAERMSEEEVRSTLESLLLVTDRPLTPKRVQEATGLSPARIREGLETLGGTYRDGVCGIVLHEVAGGFQLRTCATNSAAVKRLLQVRPHRLTRAALETLAIVAYRQPVTRPEVEEIRGVDSGAVMRALLERELVQVLGKKEEPGRPLLYGTTRAFLEFFDLKDLASLPTLREFHSLDEEHEKIVEERFPEEETNIIDVLTDEEPLAEHRTEDEEAIDHLDEALRDTRRRDRALRQVLSPTQTVEDDESEDDVLEDEPEGGGDDAAGDGPPEETAG